MEKVELTFGRAFKVWWSFTWRNMVFAIPVMILMMPTMFFLIPKPVPGQKPEFPLALLVVWPIMMVAMICIQALALKYATRAKWSDFRLVAVKPEALVD